MIYVVSHYYLPTSNPPANRMGCLVRALVGRYGSHNIQVVTGRPNYPDGRLQPRDKWRLFRRETGPQGERVLHLYEIPAPFRGFYRKTIGYLSFAASVFFFFLFKPLAKNDLVLVTSGPVFPAYAIWLISRFRRRLRYIIDVRDLSPQTILGMGYMKETDPSYRFLKTLSDRMYAGAEAAVGVVEGIRDYLQTVTPPDKAFLIYNPIDTDLVSPRSPMEIAEFRKNHPEIFPDPGQVTFLFSGALSVYMDLQTLLNALLLVNRRARHYRFLIVGYGEEQDNLRNFVGQNDLKQNVLFLPHMDRKALVDYICAVDFCYSSYNAHPIYQMAISIKILEYLACNKFLLGAHEGPFFKIIESRGFARVTPPGNAITLAEAILELIENRDKLINPAGAREFIVETFARSQFEKRYLDVFNRVQPQ